jgi:hypothetical protein
VRRAAVQEQRDGVELEDQPAGVGRGLRRLEAVVERHQLDALALHAALRVDRVDPQAGADGGLLHAGGGRAGEARGLADHELRPWGGCRDGNEKGKNERVHAPGDAVHRGLLLSWSLFVR